MYDDYIEEINSIRDNFDGMFLEKNMDEKLHRKFLKSCAEMIKFWDELKEDKINFVH